MRLRRHVWYPENASGLWLHKYAIVSLRRDVCHSKIVNHTLSACPHAGKPELKAHLQKFSNKPFVEAMADFHLLLWLAKQPNLDLSSDLAILAEAVREKSPVPEGYKLIIESIAET